MLPRPLSAAGTSRPGHLAAPTAGATRPSAILRAAPARDRPKAEAQAPAKAPAQQNALVRILRAVGAWFAALWTAVASLWRGSPPPPAELLDNAPRNEKVASPPAPAILARATSSAPRMGRRTLAIPLPEPMARTHSCPPAIHHAPPSAPVTPLSTPSSTSALPTPPLSTADDKDASYTFVDAPNANHASERQGWWSYLYGTRAPQTDAAEGPKFQRLELVGAHQVADLLRQQLMAADTHELHGAASNDPMGLLAHAPPATLLGADGRWLGLARQFPTDAFRQQVVVTSRDTRGNSHTVALGAHPSKPAAFSHEPGSIDAMADHLLRVCDGDIRWRFQLSQLLNQTVPNAVVHSLVTSQALHLGDTAGVMLGTSPESSFEVVRRSHKRLLINHTTIWRGDAQASAENEAPRLPFYIDSTGNPHRFTGEARQVVRIALARPRRLAAAPRIGRIAIELTGTLIPEL